MLPHKKTIGRDAINRVSTQDESVIVRKLNVN